MWGCFFCLSLDRESQNQVDAVCKWGSMKSVVFFWGTHHVRWNLFFVIVKLHAFFSREDYLLLLWHLTTVIAVDVNFLCFCCCRIRRSSFCCHACVFFLQWCACGLASDPIPSRSPWLGAPMNVFLGLSSSTISTAVRS